MTPRATSHAMPAAVAVPPDDGAGIDAVRQLFDTEFGAGVFTCKGLIGTASDNRSLLLGAFGAPGQAAPPGIAPSTPARLLVGAAVFSLLGPADRDYYRPFGAAAERLLAGRAAGSIVAVAVRAGFRRQKIGQLLVGEGLRWLAGQRCDLATAVSWVSGGPNPSEPLFEKLTFHPVARAPDVYLPDSVARGWACPSCGGPCRCDGILYARQLAAAGSGLTPL